MFLSKYARTHVIAFRSFLTSECRTRSRRRLILRATYDLFSSEFSTRPTKMRLSIHDRSKHKFIRLYTDVCSPSTRGSILSRSVFFSLLRRFQFHFINFHLTLFIIRLILNALQRVHAIFVSAFRPNMGEKVRMSD